MQAELIVGTDFIIDPNEFSVKSDQPAFAFHSVYSVIALGE